MWLAVREMMVHGKGEPGFLGGWSHNSQKKPNITYTSSWPVSIYVNIMVEAEKDVSTQFP